MSPVFNAAECKVVNRFEDEPNALVLSASGSTLPCTFMPLVEFIFKIPVLLRM
jgi:hypothetical protein